MSKPLTGRGVLLLLIGFFGVILATNVVFIVLALFLPMVKLITSLT